jgi:putative restriction endonuclease
MKRGGSSPSKTDLMNREAVGRFVPAIQHMLLHDSALPGEVVSVVLNNHFPDSIHEDILAATHLDQLPTAKPKRDPKFREQVLRAYGYRCAVCAFDLRISLTMSQVGPTRWE